jgi:4-hydroxy-tetrahydrodipicolinate synthase
MYEQGVDGIVMAMVSEVLRMSTEERRELAEAACRYGHPLGPVVISVGAESAKVATDLARHAENLGATAVMAIPPLSTTVAQEELFSYYEAILASISIPVIVQDASAYIGQPMTAEMQARLLSEHTDRVLFKPESQDLTSRLTALLHATNGAARLFAGSGGANLADSHRLGVVGTMPGADVCWAVVALWKALESGDHARAGVIAAPLGELLALQTSLDAFVAIEKYLLVRQGVFTSSRVRGPVAYKLDGETAVELDRILARLQDAVES